jgi:hypothetical protein
MPRTLKSTLTGIWLMQVVKTSVPVPCRIEYTVRHRGDGKNALRVRFGSYWHLIWAKIHDFDVERGKSRSRSVEIKNDTSNSEGDLQDVRWRLSRKALTKEIDWELTYTVTRLKTNIHVTNQCEPTIENTNDD